MRYKGKHLKEISFPLGGIGSGCIGLGGDGRLVDWEIFNRPAKGTRNGYTNIAIRARQGKTVNARILNGDINKEWIGRYLAKEFTGYGYGPEAESLCGFPHFKNLTFDGQFPVAKLCFSDPDFPARVHMTAFNPFIPLDDKNSSIPGAFFEIEICNESGIETDYEVVFSLQNPFDVSKNTVADTAGIKTLTAWNAGADQTDKNYGDLTVATDCTDVAYQTYWYRGGWKDPVVSFWNDLTSDEELKDRVYADNGSKDIGSLAAKIKIAPHASGKVRFVLTWNIPNCYNYWSPYQDADGKDVTWKNYYAVLFENSIQSAKYALRNWNDLYARTKRFKQILFASTLDPAVIDAASSNLAVLKSPTVLRLQDGSFYGWEGVHQQSGSCEGTCQHVWNYAYALCFLFPKLERTIRNAELKYGQMDSGKTVFRLKLPYGRDPGDYRACVDGQMGIIIKMYREWKLSGDDFWLKNNWANITKILEYAWSTENPDEWDADQNGVLEGRQHHTLDMELFGPSSWLESMYLAALKAACEMAKAVQDTEKEDLYAKIYAKGRKFLNEKLFNGAYFIQQVDLKNKNILEHFNAVDMYWDYEKEQIKYQIQNGSEIDQMLGQWHADILGLGNLFDEEKITKALCSMMQLNFKPVMRAFANPWRVFSVNDESGTIICAYPPEVQKPAIPVPYCEETMTGFEYAFAGLLAAHGKVKDALRVVKAVRDRYDGEKRNPWNEIECGSNYARSMASFALIPILSGFAFDLPHKWIGFYPRVQTTPFKCFWSLETAWGQFELRDQSAKLWVAEGSLCLSAFGIAAKNIQQVKIDGKEVNFTCRENKVHFSERQIEKTLELVF